MFKQFFGQRIWAVLATCLSIIMLVLVATSLGNIHFQAGQPLAHGGTIPLQVTVEKITEEIASIPLYKVVAFWALVFLLAIIVVSLFPPELRKKILKYFLRYVLFILALFIIVRNFRSLIPALNLAQVAAPVNNPQTVTETGPVVFTPPQVPALFLYIISLGIILVLAGVVFLIGRGWLRNRRAHRNAEPLDGLAEIARSSLSDLNSGRNWEDVIFECYARMNEAVGTRRGLVRRKDLTAGEFVARLERAGLPGESVRRLTRLFEAARYGARQASHEEVAEAIACLRSVLYACGVSE